MEKKSNCYVTKVSSTGKSIYVAFKRNKYQQGFAFGWCSNPDALAKGDDVPDFHPKNRVPMMSVEGEPLLHTDGSPVMQWVFE